MALVLMFASGCGDSAAPTEPSPVRTTIPFPGNEVLTGQVLDRHTSAPIAGATVVFSQPHPSPHAATDSLGNYSLTGLPAPGRGALVWGMAPGYEEDIQYYRASFQNFRLYPIETIAAGGSTVVTVRPDDSLCWNNVLEPGYGVDTVCRLLRIDPADGVLTVEALPTAGGTRASLVVAVAAGSRVLDERLGNPVSVEVAGATRVTAFVAIPAGSPAQSFTLTTSITPR